MNKLRTDLPDLPDRFKKLPISKRGFPVPAFVGVDDNGEFDFRVIKAGWLPHAYKYEKCWLCGEKMGRHRTFVTGPMCVINRVSAEPPSHTECARFAAEACPFLTTPTAVRNERDMPKDISLPGGNMIKRNPGVCALITARKYKPIKAGNGVFFSIEAPIEVAWVAHGKPATRSEVMDSIDSGFPLLWEVAEQEGKAAMNALRREYDQAMLYVPAG